MKKFSMERSKNALNKLALSVMLALMFVCYMLCALPITWLDAKLKKMQQREK